MQTQATYLNFEEIKERVQEFKRKLIKFLFESDSASSSSQATKIISNEESTIVHK